MSKNNTNKMITIICLVCHKLKHGYKGKISKFCSQKCTHIYQKGKNHPRWKGGKEKHTGGYIELYFPNTKKRILEHRYIMEQKLGRKLLITEVVHHINGIRTDNRFQNLVICSSPGRHISQFHPRKMKKFWKASPYNN